LRWDLKIFALKQTQILLLCLPSSWDYSRAPPCLDYIIFVKESGSPYGAQFDTKLLSSSSASASASQVVGTPSICCCAQLMGSDTEDTDKAGIQNTQKYLPSVPPCSHPSPPPGIPLGWQAPSFSSSGSLNGTSHPQVLQHLLWFLPSAWPDLRVSLSLAPTSPGDQRPCLLVTVSSRRGQYEAHRRCWFRTVGWMPE
jgi:hypothetical protein